VAGSPPVNFTATNVHQNVPLTQFSIAYRPTGLIAESIAPVIKVAHESDLWYVWDKGQRFRVERSDGYGSMRADKAEVKVLNYGATLKSYTAFEFALATEISDRELANQDSVLQLEVSKVQAVQDSLLLDQEIRVANLFYNTANYPAGNFATLSGTSQWNNASFLSQTNGAHSIIKQQIELGKEAVRKSTGGLLPNTIILPRAVASVLFNDVGLADLIKFNTNNPMANLLSADFIPETLWGMKVLIPTGIYQTAVEGEAFNGADVWGKNVWMGYVNPTPGPNTLTFGNILRVREWNVKQYREERRDVTVYRPSIVQTEQLIAGDAGYLIVNAVA